MKNIKKTIKLFIIGLATNLSLAQNTTTYRTLAADNSNIINISITYLSNGTAIITKTTSPLDNLTKTTDYFISQSPNYTTNYINSELIVNMQPTTNPYNYYILVPAATNLTPEIINASSTIKISCISQDCQGDEKCGVQYNLNNNSLVANCDNSCARSCKIQTTKTSNSNTQIFSESIMVIYAKSITIN